MMKAGLYWPLQSNTIRKGAVSNTFGMVRNGGKRPHQGWDLQAAPGTRCYAVADGQIVYADAKGKFGKLILFKFQHRERTLYAAYAHLSLCIVRDLQQVVGGEFIGMTGNTGNAEMMEGDDQHLHFEIRTIEHPGLGLVGRIDPRQFYGFTPLNMTVYAPRPEVAQGMGMSAPGLKVRGVNVL